MTEMNNLDELIRARKCRGEIDELIASWIERGVTEKHYRRILVDAINRIPYIC